MSRNHPNALRLSSGTSVRFTNSAHSGATARRSRTFRQLGAFPVRGSAYFRGSDSEGWSARYSRYTRFMLSSLGAMYWYSNPTAWPIGLKISGTGERT